MTAADLRARLEEALRARVDDAVSAGPPEAFALEGKKPALVFAPATLEEAGACLALCDEAGAAVLPWGGGTQMDFGEAPSRYDLALDLRRLDRVVEYEPADLTVTVEAGLRLADLQARLGERGQWLPLDPPLPPDATIGGVLATNASGPARIAYGTARDHVIGMTVALADGQLVRSGGRVVKNVAGYDMAKLHIGAFGTLGVILQVSFKVAPRPLVERTLVFEGDAERLGRLSKAIWDGGLAVNGLALVRRDGTWRLVARFAGSAAAVERSERDSTAFAEGLALKTTAATADAWEPAPDPKGGDGPVRVRLSLLPSDLIGCLTALEDATALLAYPTAGVAHVAWKEAPASRLRELRAMCESRGGALVLAAAPPMLKREVGVWGSTRQDFAIMRRLKEQFDPKGTLAPGRYLGGL